MDDPLRQKSVPLAAETVLWFEFLIDPSLLTAYLQKNGNDGGPSPLELITQFLSKPSTHQPISVQTIDLPVTPCDTSVVGDPFEAFQLIGRKQLAQKILSLKVASFLKWELDVFERNLPIQKQVQLLQDLCIITSGKMLELPITAETDLTLGVDGNRNAFKFALTLYHRWVLRTQLLKELPSRLVKSGQNSIIIAHDPNNPFRSDLFITSLDATIPNSLDYLKRIVASAPPPSAADSEPDHFVALSYDSFTTITSANPAKHRQAFDQMTPISHTELRCQIYFDLCTFHLHAKQYDLARDNAQLCRKSLVDLKREYAVERSGLGEFLFCTIDEKELDGCLMACGVGDTSQIGLLHRMNAAQLNGLVGLTEILHEDNVRQEISLVNRRILELDIECMGSMGLPANLRVEVAALNCLRATLEPDSLFTFNDFLLKYRSANGVAVLVEFAGAILPRLDVGQRQRIRRMFQDLLVTSRDGKSEARIVAKLGLFGEEELLGLQQRTGGGGGGRADELELPAIVNLQDWKIGDFKIPRLEIGALRRQLVNCSNPQKIKVLLVKLAATNPNQPLWSINPSWSLPNNLHSVIMSLQRSFLQDFAYILLGKAKELTAKNDYTTAIAMLANLKSECNRPELVNNVAVRKLEKLIDWEILHIQIAHSLDAWPRPCYDQPFLAAKCKQCLIAFHGGEAGMPRLEIVDHCAAMLLNMGEWLGMTWPDKRVQSIELCAAFAVAVTEAESFGTKKMCRDAWELLLPMFVTANHGNSSNANNGGGKGRGGGGGGQQQSGGGGGARDSPALVGGTNLAPFFKKLRHVSIISVVLSLLSRLHNILRDDANMEIQYENMALWPTSVSNANAYNIRIVSDTLYGLLKQGLHYYPQHISWLRLSGEYEFVNENNESAMACYVNTLLTGTEFCTLHLQRPLLDDYIVRRMIKVALNLGCNMQAAVLCQLLDECDYVLAFKCIAERTTFKNIGDRSKHFCDAMDAYYGCVWDATLLEYIIQLHSRKGEHKRKQQAIAIMGQLELNANNNEEIKREAASIRRIRFLRAMAKQYLL